MISEQQKEVQKELINLKEQIVQATGGNPLYKVITNKLDNLIKDMGTKEYSQEKLDSAKLVFGNLAKQLK